MINGTLVPTTISASSLSSATIVGVERTLLSASEAIALNNAPKLILSPAKFPSANDNPLSNEGAAPASKASMVPASRPVAPSRFVNPTGPSLPVASSRKLIPSSRILSSLISAMTASTITCARRISRRSMIASMVVISAGGAVMIKELVFESVLILTREPPLSPPANVSETGNSISPSSSESLFTFVLTTGRSLFEARDPKPSSRTISAISSASAKLRNTTRVLPPDSTGESSPSIRRRILLRAAWLPLINILLVRSSATS